MKKVKRKRFQDVDIPLSLMCIFMLITSPLCYMQTGCRNRSGTNSPNHKPDEQQPDDRQVKDTDSCESLLTDEIEGLKQWWVIKYGDDESSIWGEGLGKDSDSRGSVIIDVTMENGSKATLSITNYHKHKIEGTLHGEDILEQEFILECSSSLNLLEGHAGNSKLVLYPAQFFRQADTGVYFRKMDGAEFVLGLDVGFGGYKILLSELGLDGTWPDEGRFDLKYDSDNPRVEGWEGTAIRFDGGDRVFLCHNDSNYKLDFCDVLQRSPTQSELNGAWLIGDNFMYSWPGTGVPAVEWFLGILVEHNNIFYIHERNEGLYDSVYNGLSRALRAPRDSNGQYRDTDHDGYSYWYDWIGRVKEDKSRIVGHWDYPDWGFYSYHHSFTRTIKPPAGYLTKEASSLSINWMNFAFGIQAIDGTAQMIQENEKLTIIDHSNDGAVYQIDAYWTGYQYEGQWWMLDEPETRGLWRGQLLCDGMYLHGTWDHGEYSFSLVPFSADPLNDVTEPGEDRVIVVPDLHSPDLFVSRTPDGGILTVHRNQDRVNGATLITADDETIKLYVDARLRPVQLDNITQGIYSSFEWNEDSTEVTVIQNKNGSITEEIVSLDLSDDKLIAAAEKMELDEGIDLSDFREWIQDNPGRFIALARGEIEPPDVSIPPLPVSFLKNNDNPYNYQFFIEALYGIGAYLTLLSGSTTALLTGKHIVVVALGAYGTALLLGIGVIWLLANLYLAATGFRCDPCSLACFVNCI